MKNYWNFYTMKILKESQEFQKFMSDLGVAINKVTTIYPHIFIILLVWMIKNNIWKIGGSAWLTFFGQLYIFWMPYDARCCVWVRKIGMITLNEREQTKAMIKDKLMGEEQLAFAEQDVSNETINLNTKELQELQIVDCLEKVCLERGKKYVK